MKDFNFWIGLSLFLYNVADIIKEKFYSANSEISELQEELKTLNKNLINSKNEGTVTKKTLKEIDNKISLIKSKIFKLSIDITLTYLKSIVQNYEENKPVSLIEIKTCLEIAKGIVKKSQQEYFNAPENEKRFFAMIKIFAHKCIAQVVKKSQNIIEKEFEKELAQESQLNKEIFCEEEVANAV